ncbi:MAG: extracellular solute-binding protein [Clostridia bacterium]|nr:extracellular solute-binding protein [Clostridia bacterium]
MRHLTWRNLFFIVIIILVSGYLIKNIINDSSQQPLSQTAKTDDAEKTPKKLSGKIVFATNRVDKVDTTLADLARDFTKKNPETEIQFEGMIDDFKIISIKMAANELPDIAPVIDSLKREYYPRYFTPIDDLGFTKDDLYLYDSGLGEDGKLYSLPNAVVYSGFIYNKACFKAAGIQSVPRTTDEFFKACESLKSKGILPVASNFKDVWPLNWYGIDFAVATTGNGDYQNRLTKKDEPLSGDSGMLAGFEFARQLKEKGYLEKNLVSTNWDSMKRDFGKGKIGMVFLGSWFIPQVIENGLSAEDAGIFPVPGAKAIVFSKDKSFGIAAGSNNVELAKAFLKYCWEEGRYSNAVGDLSPLKSVKPKLQTLKELISYGLPVVDSIPQNDDYNTIINSARFNWGNVLQEYLLANNPDEVVKKYNRKWKEAKASHGK